MGAVGDVGRALLRGFEKPAAAVSKETTTRTSETLARDFASATGHGLTEPVADLVTFARQASALGNREITEKAFRNAALASYCAPMAGLPELEEALRVAAIARSTPLASNAVPMILVDAKDRFSSYAARTRIAAAARDLGQRELHLDLVGGLATWAPGVKEHLRLADDIETLAAQDPAFKPLVDKTLRRANDRTETIFDTAGVKQSAQNHQDHGAYLEALAIEETLRTMGQTDARWYRPTVRGILEALREPGAKAYQPVGGLLRRSQRLLRTTIQRWFGSQATPGSK